MWTSIDWCQFFIDQIMFTLNDGTTPTVNVASTGVDPLVTYNIPAGYEFVGFRGMSGPTGWGDMQVYITCATTAFTGIVINLTNINGKFQTVTAGATVSIPFTVTDAISGACGVVYSVSVTPAFTTTSLISIPNSATPAV
jgi:hypothetical protein